VAEGQLVVVVAAVDLEQKQSRQYLLPLTQSLLDHLEAVGLLQFLPKVAMEEIPQ
jgi:hypothetical protein